MLKVNYGKTKDDSSMKNSEDLESHMLIVKMRSFTIL